MGQRRLDAAKRHPVARALVETVGQLHVDDRRTRLLQHLDGDVEGAENVRRSVSDWLRFMDLIPAGVNAELDRYIGYWEPYATSHEALDADRAMQEEVLNAARTLVEAAKASGLGTLDIIWRVYLREGRVPIIRVSALSFINVVAFSAMAGVVGGGGLGNLAIIRGYNRFQSDVTLVATLIILVIVFVSQLICNLLAKRLQH